MPLLANIPTPPLMVYFALASRVLRRPFALTPHIEYNTLVFFNTTNVNTQHIYHKPVFTNTKKLEDLARAPKGVYKNSDTLT